MLVNQTVRAGGETRRTHDSGTPKLFNIGLDGLKKKSKCYFSQQVFKHALSVYVMIATPDTWFISRFNQITKIGIALSCSYVQFK